MQEPPLSGDPYTYVDPTASNFGLQGVTVGWDSIRAFWGGVAQQGVQDLLNITSGGGTVV